MGKKKSGPTNPVFFRHLVVQPNIFVWPYRLVLLKMGPLYRDFFWGGGNRPLRAAHPCRPVYLINEYSSQDTFMCLLSLMYALFQNRRRNWLLHMPGGTILHSSKMSLAMCEVIFKILWYFTL